MLKQSASQTVGPYFRIGLIYGETQNDLVQAQTAGERILIQGVLYDKDGAPIPDGMIEIWQPDGHGIFNHEADPLHAQADPHFCGFGRAENRDNGRFQFHTIKPGGRDGQVPYINVRVFARGILIHAVTRLYFSDEVGNADDAVLQSVPVARRQTLIATRDDSGDLPTYHFDIHMQGEQETIFFEIQ